MHISAEGVLKNRHSQLNLLVGLLLAVIKRLFQFSSLLAPTHDSTGLSSFRTLFFIKPNVVNNNNDNNNRAGLLARPAPGTRDGATWEPSRRGTGRWKFPGEQWTPSVFAGSVFPPGEGFREQADRRTGDLPPPVFPRG